MPVDPNWGKPLAPVTPRSVSVGKRPKKVAPPPAAITSTPTPRMQQINAQFGGGAGAAGTNVGAMSDEFTADLPDPPVVGLNAHPRPQVQLPPPAVPPANLATNTPGVTVPPELGAAGPAPPLPEQAQDPHAGESPTDRMVREAGERYSAAMSEQPHKRKGLGGRILSGLESFVIEGGRPFRNAIPNSPQELAYGLARGAGAGAYGAVNTEYPSRVRIESKRALRGQEHNQALKYQQTETQNRLRVAQADYAAGRGMREDRKIELKNLLDQAKLRLQSRGLDVREQNYRAIQELRRQGVINDQEELELRRTVAEQQNEDRDLDRAERVRARESRERQWGERFDWQKRTKEQELRLAEERTRAYVENAGKGGNSAALKQAQGARMADVYENEADRLEDERAEFVAGTEEGDKEGSVYRAILARIDAEIRRNRLNAEKSRAAGGLLTDASRSTQAVLALPDEDSVRADARSRGATPTQVEAAVRKWKRLKSRQGR